MLGTLCAVLTSGQYSGGPVKALNINSQVKQQLVLQLSSPQTR